MSHLFPALMQWVGPEPEACELTHFEELGRARSLLGGEAGDETGDVGEQQDNTKWALEMGA